MNSQNLSANFNSENLTLTKRIISIDLLRGLVMVLMVLDHTRDFFSNVRFNPLDITQSNFPLFMTRWITHLCAPSFILLAGVAAYLSLKRGKTLAELSRFLLIRGLCLIVLESTIISWAWGFPYWFLMGGVIWVIGWSMIILALLIPLDMKLIAIFSITLIVGHNLCDGIQVEQLGNWGWLWAFLHQRTRFELIAGIPFVLVYSLIPWVGVMAGGYVLGTIFTWEKQKRLRWLRNWGLGLLVSFVVLRGINLYGDPNPWSEQSNTINTFLSFINCTKYPPSLLYLLITLSLSFLLLYCFEKYNFSILKPLIVFGRVPLFFYLIHLWIIRLFAILFALPHYGLNAFILPYFISRFMPSDYGFDLHHVYVFWIIILIALYPLCQWFYHYKSQHHYQWLNYL